MQEIGARSTSSTARLGSRRRQSGRYYDGIQEKSRFMRKTV